MRYEIEVEGRLRQVVVNRVGGGFAVELEGRRWYVDAARVDAHTLSLLVGMTPSQGDTGDPVERADGLRQFESGGPDDSGSGGSSHEVTMTSGADGRSVAYVGSTPLAIALNGRRRKGEVGAHAADGPQRITAPMPGKIVRVLVAPGDAVHARQALVVVEAMKMENELRAGRDGTIAKIHVKEGTSVDAGAPLIDIL